MTLHPQAATLVATLAELGELDLAAMDLVDARAMMAATRAPVEGIATGGREDLTVPVRDGASIKARHYRPAGDEAGGDGQGSLLIYYHGGGWVFGDLEGHDALCQSLSNRLKTSVISVDYRLAPEHRFPIPLHDCFDALVWCRDNAATLGIDADKIIVGGDSAGGNLAAAVSMMARDGRAAHVAAQVLYYPVTDRDFTRASYSENESGYLLTKKGMAFFWESYVNGNEDDANPLAAPLQADDLSGLPPAFVLTAGYDPLRDEGRAYAAALTGAGNHVHAVQHDDQIHGFVSMIGQMDSAMKAIEQTAQFLDEQGLI